MTANWRQRIIAALVVVGAALSSAPAWTQETGPGVHIDRRAKPEVLDDKRREELRLLDFMHIYRKNK